MENQEKSLKIIIAFVRVVWDVQTTEHLSRNQSAKLRFKDLLNLNKWARQHIR